MDTTEPPLHTTHYELFFRITDSLFLIGDGLIKLFLYFLMISMCYIILGATRTAMANLCTGNIWYPRRIDKSNKGGMI